MLTDRSDYGAPPKRRVTTYGKAGKRQASASTFASWKKESATTEKVSRATASPPRSSPEPESEPTRVNGNTTRKPRVMRQYNRTGRSNDHNTAQSQPNPTIDATSESQEDGLLQSKKRKLARSQSDTREKSAGAYSTPESSPDVISTSKAYLDDLYEIQSPPRKKSKSPPGKVEVHVRDKAPRPAQPTATNAESDPYRFDDSLPPLKRAKSQVPRTLKDVSNRVPSTKSLPQKIPAPVDAGLDDPYAFEDSPDSKKSRPLLRKAVKGVDDDHDRKSRPKIVPDSRPAPVEPSARSGTGRAQISTARAAAKPAVTQARPRNISQQHQHQIPLRLSRDQGARQSGIIKSRALSPPSRPVLQTALSAPARPTAQTKLSVRANSKSQATSTVSTRSATPVDNVTTTTAAKGRKRLIDALASQQEDSSSEDEENASQSTQEFQPPKLPEMVFPMAASSTVKTRNVRPGASKRPGPKFTYGGGKITVVDEDAVMGDAGPGGFGEGSSKAPFIDFSSLARASETNNTFSYEDEEDVGNSGAVRSIHELRQAGANHRFADEMADVLDRIGVPTAKPSSMRRGALLELAEKMPEKDFRRQFRNHGARGGLFEHLGEETDVVSGFAILSILVALLGTSNSSHLIQQLRIQSVGSLLTRMFRETSDIRQIARDRRTNVTKNGQNTLLGIKSSMLKLSVWEPAMPTSLSPRTLALKCLELILRQSVDSESGDELFSSSVTEVLFSILSAGAADDNSWDFPAQESSNVFYLALYLLEGHSVSAMQSHRRSKWTSDYAPIVADVLETALRRPSEKQDEIRSLVFRLVLNITNKNPEACGLFVERNHLHGLARVACDSFDGVLSSAENGNSPSKKTPDIFMLGVMINCCEYYDPAIANLAQLAQENTSPVSRLIRVFLDHRSNTSNASEEASNLNVTFGYVSVLLGYLCMHGIVRDRFEAIHGRMTLAPLVDAISEFVKFHRLAIQSLDSKDRSQNVSGPAERLERLINQLEYPSS